MFLIEKRKPIKARCCQCRALYAASAEELRGDNVALICGPCRSDANQQARNFYGYAEAVLEEYIRVSARVKHC